MEAKVTWSLEVEAVWPAHGLGALCAQYDHYHLATVNEQPTFLPSLYNPQAFQGKWLTTFYTTLGPPEFVGHSPWLKQECIDGTTAPKSI